MQRVKAKDRVPPHTHTRGGSSVLTLKRRWSRDGKEPVDLLGLTKGELS